MMLYSAGEIVKKLHGVTTRQILDLAEKGLIKPARETTGAGSPRLYDFQNVFEICICLAVRGRIPAGTATTELIGNVLQSIRELSSEVIQKEEKTSERVIKAARARAGFPTSESQSFYSPPFDILLIAYDDRDSYSFYPISYNETFGKELRRVKKYRPQNYCTYIIEVKTLWEYLKTIF